MSNKMSLKDFRKKGCVSEKEEQKMCLQFLHTIPGMVVWRQNTGRAKYQNKDGSFRTVSYGVRGISDIIGYFRSENGVKPFFWEVKTAKGKLSQAQKEFLDKVIQDDCLAGYGTCEDLINYIRSIDI